MASSGLSGRGGKTSTSASPPRTTTATRITDGEQIYKWSKMFDKILPSGGLKMRVNLPDTVLVDSEQKVLSWYYTTEGGYIASKNVQRSTLLEVVTEFCANMFEDTRVNPNLYVAVAYFTDQRRVLLRRSDILNIVRQKEKKDKKKMQKLEKEKPKQKKQKEPQQEEPQILVVEQPPPENQQGNQEEQETGNKHLETGQTEGGSAQETTPVVDDSNTKGKEGAGENDKEKNPSAEETLSQNPAGEGQTNEEEQIQVDTPKESEAQAEEVKEEEEEEKAEVLSAEEILKKFKDFFGRPFMLQQYFPPSLDRRYVCRYSSDKMSGKVGFSIVTRRYSDRYTNNLDVSVDRVVQGATETVNHLMTSDVLPLPSHLQKNEVDKDKIERGNGSLSSSKQPKETDKKKLLKDSDDVPEHPRDMGFKSEVRKAVTSMVNFIERNHRIDVTSCVVEFVRGLEGRPWFLMLEGLPSSRMSRGSASQTRFNTAARESASRLGSRPRSASPMRKSAKTTSSGPQILRINSRPSSAKGKPSSSIRPSLQSRNNVRSSGTAKTDNLSSFESSLVEALSQDIEILKEKIQQQNDMLEQTESALKRELERRKADQINSTNEIIKLREENENLKKEKNKLLVENSLFKEKSAALEQENFDILRSQDEKQSDLRNRVTNLQNMRDELKDKCRDLQFDSEQYQSQKEAATNENTKLQTRLSEEQETVAAVRAQLVALRKKLLDTEAKNKELDIKVSSFAKGGKSVRGTHKRRIIAPEDPAALAMRAEQVVNSLNSHDLMVDYEPGYGDEKENEDVNQIRQKICEVLCNNVESLQDIYNYYAQLGEVNRQGHSLLMNETQFLKFATDIDYFGEEGTAALRESNEPNVDDIDVIFSRIVSKDDTHTRITFTGFLEGICRLAYGKYGSSLKILIVEEDEATPEERQRRIEKQANIVMNFLANLLRRARWNKLGGSSMNKQKAQWRKALEKSLKIQRLAKAGRS